MATFKLGDKVCEKKGIVSHIYSNVTGWGRIYGAAMSKLRYGVVYWRGPTLKFQSFIRLEQAKVFCEIELRQHRDCRMLQYDANKHPMSWVKERMLTALRFESQGESRLCRSMPAMLCWPHSNLLPS